MGPVSLCASNAVLGGKNPSPHRQWVRAEQFELLSPPSSDTNQPKESVSLPPCLFLMLLLRQVSSPELDSTWSRRAHGIPCVPRHFTVPLSQCVALQRHHNRVTLEREKEKAQREHMWRAGGNGCCKVSNAFKEVFVWGLFSYPLGNFTAEKAGPFRQWPKQYPHCLSGSRGSVELGGQRETGKRNFFYRP